MPAWMMRPAQGLVTATLVGLWLAACAQGAASTTEVYDDDGVLTTGPGSTGTGSTTSTGTGASGGGGAGASTATSGGGGSGGYPCTEDPCKLTSPQCGCAPGDKCTLSGATRTCTPDGAKQIGEVCSGNECVAGSLCVTYGAATNATSSCKNFCTSDAECQAPGGRCLLELTDGSMNLLATVCSENCDPVSTVGCAAGLACDAAVDPGGNFTVCRNAGAGTQGSACIGSNGDDCAAGFGCVTIDSVTQCGHYCNVAAPACPGSGEQCLSFQTPLTIGGVEYGVCYAP